MTSTKFRFFSLLSLFLVVSVMLGENSRAETTTKEYTCPTIRVTRKVTFTDKALQGWKIYPGGAYIEGKDEYVHSELSKVENIGGTTVLTCTASYQNQPLVASRAYNASDVTCTIKPGSKPDTFTCNVRVAPDAKGDAESHGATPDNRNASSAKDVK